MKINNFRFYEWLVYAILWGWTWAFPVLNTFLTKVHSGTGFEWNGIFRLWAGIAPFFILFLIHHLLVRHLLLRRRMRVYMASALCVLCLFGVFRYTYMGRIRKPGIMQAGHIQQHGLHDADDPPPDGKYPDRAFTKKPERGKKPLGHKPLRPAGRFDGGLPEPLIFDLGIAVLMLGFDLAIVLFSRYQQEQERASRQETAHLQHELESLKAQIRPHFLMNMLNNIHGMVELNPTMAQEMIMELSRLMRYVLYEGERLYTTLKAEMEFISCYVALMRKRYSDTKVEIALHLPEPLSHGDIKLPPLLFIVIIENAFKHGISYRHPSFIDMSMEVGGGRIRFDCVNSRFARAGKPDKYHGIGLANLNKRLQLLYGEDFTLATEEREHTYAVNLVIPYKQDKADEKDKMPGDRR